MALSMAEQHRPTVADPFPWKAFIERFETGAWRAPIFRDMVLEDIRARGPAPRILDIGCGRGFDDDARMQQDIAREAGHYIGIEPDDTVDRPPVCHQYLNCLLEDAPIEPGTIDVAFTVFVIEHLEKPAPFFEAVHRVLKPGGAFWGFTIDARSPYAKLSSAMQVVALKDRYLDVMFGRRDERHRNYPTHYAANTPAAIEAVTRQFTSVDAISLHHVGIIDGVIPKPVRPLWHMLDRTTMKRGWPGTNLVIRLVK